VSAAVQQGSCLLALSPGGSPSWARRRVGLPEQSPASKAGMRPRRQRRPEQA
jgi:hypothetical protein